MSQTNLHKLTDKLFDLPYGEVWFGEYKSHKKVLVEIFKKELSQDQKIKETLEHYANNLFYLVHPNILQIIVTGYSNEGNYYIAYEIDRVKNLHHMLQNNLQPWKINFACYLVIKVCEAIEHAHTTKHPLESDFTFIHGSLSPKKIFINDKGEVKIYGFNTIIALSKKEKPYIFIEEGYKAPEHFSIATNITQKTDIFSIGILFYHLLTGKLPFGNQQDWNSWKNFPFESTLDYPLQKEILEIIKLALNLDPNTRFESVGKLKKELNNIILQNKLVLHRTDVKRVFDSLEKEVLTSNQNIERAPLEVEKEFIKEEEPKSLPISSPKRPLHEDTVSDLLKKEAPSNTNFKHDSALIPIDIYVEPPYKLKPEEENHNLVEEEDNIPIEIEIEHPKHEPEEKEKSPWIKFLEASIKAKENPKGVKYLYGNSELIPIQRDLILILEGFVESLFQENKLYIEYLKNEHQIKRLKEEISESHRLINTFSNDFTTLVDDYIGFIKGNQSLYEAFFDLKEYILSYLNKKKKEITEINERQLELLSDNNNNLYSKVVKFLDPILILFPIPIRDAELFYSISGSSLSLKVYYVENINVEYELLPTSPIPEEVNRVVEGIELIVDKFQSKLLKRWNYRTELIDDFIIEKIQFRSKGGQIVVVKPAAKISTYNILFLYRNKGIDIEIYKQLDRETFNKIDIPQNETTTQNLLTLHNKLLSIIEDNIIHGNKFTVKEIYYDKENKVVTPLDAERILAKLASILSPYLQDMVIKSSSTKEISLKLELKTGKREEKYISRQSIEEKIKQIQDSWKYIIHLIGLAN